MSNPALTEVLASYVPKLIQNRIIADPSPIESPLAEEFQATLLFADISGFTLLTERLAEKGPTGVETLARILNDLQTASYDGVVCVEETTVEGMRERALVPRGHSMLIVSGRVGEMI